MGPCLGIQSSLRLTAECDAGTVCNHATCALRMPQRVQASALFMEAEEEAMEIPEKYTPATADSISYGTFMKLKMEEQADGSEALHNMLRWLYANAEFSAAAVATELSVTRWADDDQFGFSGDHVWLPGAPRPDRCQDSDCSLLRWQGQVSE